MTARPDLVRSLYTLARSLPWDQPHGMSIARALVDAAKEIERLRALKEPKARKPPKPKPRTIIESLMSEADIMHNRYRRRGLTTMAQMAQSRLVALREAHMALNGKDARDNFK